MSFIHIFQVLLVGSLVWIAYWGFESNTIREPLDDRHPMTTEEPSSEFSPTTLSPRIVPQSILDRHPKNIQSLLVGQLREDERLGSMVAVNLESNDERFFMDNTHLVQVQLRGLVSRRDLAAIFTTSNPNIILKYELNCGTSLISSLMRDYWMHTLLAKKRVVGEVYYLSPPTALMSTMTMKTDYKFTHQSRSDCLALGGTVRFMAMERMRSDLWTLGIQRLWPLRTVMGYLRQMLVGIGKMHALGIIHGDIHPGNVMLNNRDEIRFIDFGEAFFESEFPFKREIVRPRLSYVHCFFSHWRLEGWRYSFRDDVFNAVFVAAFLLNGKPFMDYCRSLQSKPIQMLRWKSEDFLFGLTIGSEGLVPMRLRKILELARSADRLNQKPNIQAIINQIDLIVKPQV